MYKLSLLQRYFKYYANIRVRLIDIEEIICNKNINSEDEANSFNPSSNIKKKIIGCIETKNKLFDCSIHYIHFIEFHFLFGDCKK